MSGIGGVPSLSGGRGRRRRRHHMTIGDHIAERLMVVAVIVSALTVVVVFALVPAS